MHATGLVKSHDHDDKIKFLAAEALREVGGRVIEANGNRFAKDLGDGEMWKNKSYMPISLAQNSVFPWNANVPDVSDAEGSDDLSMVVFRSEVLWQCKPGFSKDHVVGSNNAVTALCRWNGTFSVPAMCHNSDDCAENLCRSHSVSRDKAIPTGVHLDDHICDTVGPTLRGTATSLILQEDHGGCWAGGNPGNSGPFSDVFLSAVFFSKITETCKNEDEGSFQGFVQSCWK